MDSSFVGAFVADSDWQVIECNKALRESLGFTKTEIEQRSIRWDELTPPEFAERDLQAYAEIEASGSCAPYEKECLRKDGSRVPVLMSGCRLHAESSEFLAFVFDLSEIKNAQKALTESEHRLRLALTASKQGLYDLNIPTGETLVSPEYEQILGYGPGELKETYEKWAHRLHPDDAERVTANYNNYIDGNIPYFAVEFRQKTRDGKWKWILSLGNIVERDSSGNPLRILGTHTDITERKLGEEALQASEAKFRALVEQSLTGIYVFRGDRFLYVNRQFTKIFGYSEEEILNDLKPTDVVAPEDREMASENIRRRFSGDVESIHYLARGIRKDGTIIWIEIHGSRIELDGEPTITGTVIDITARKESEQRLRLYNERLRILRDIDKDIVASRSMETITRTVLRRVSQLIPCSAANIFLFDENTNEAIVHISKHGSETSLTPGVRLPLSPRDKLERIKAGEIISVPNVDEFEGPKSPAFHILVSEGMHSIVIAPLSTQGKTIGVLALSSDEPEHFSDDHREILVEVSNQLAVAIGQAQLNEQILQHSVNLELRVKERTEQLQTANQELEAFSYSVSHDLRAPLRTIDGYSRALLEDYEDQLGDNGKSYIHRIRVSTRRMGRLIDDLLRLSRISRTELHIGEIDLTHLAKEAIHELQASAPDRKVDVFIEKDMVSRADRRLIHVVVENLLRNSWKYTKGNPEARIQFSCQAQGGETIYCVRDNGAGFDMAYAEKLFVPFQRLHREEEFEGDGIGLAITQRIIRHHGGRIWAEGEVQKGASFYFTLPSNANR